MRENKGADQTVGMQTGRRFRSCKIRVSCTVCGWKLEVDMESHAWLKPCINKKSNGLARMLKKLRTSKGDYWIKQ